MCLHGASTNLFTDQYSGALKLDSHQLVRVPSNGVRSTATNNTTIYLDCRLVYTFSSPFFYITLKLLEWRPEESISTPILCPDPTT